jgi:uncharacterized membrane protein YfcA
VTLQGDIGPEVDLFVSSTFPEREGVMAALVSLSASHVILLILGGLGAGVFNGVAGGGSLISFPLLLALGFPALTANVTNTVGIWPGYLGGAAGFRREISDQRTQLVRLSPIAMLGGVTGAVLLLTTSSALFTSLAPWLVLGASVLFAIQPWLRRALNSAKTDDDTAANADLSAQRRHSVLLVGGTFAASVYGGYFGAGLGVMLLAILGLALPDSIARTSGMRTVLSILVNGVAASVFLIHGGLAWQAVGFLAIGSVVGGWVGARLALAISPTALRVAVVLIGLGTTVKLLAS